MATIDISSLDITPQDIERLWSKVKFGTPDECWMWQGAPDEGGYGLFKHHGRMLRVSRVIYFLHHGKDLGDNLACHHCDTPGCCNWDHIFAGTPQANTDDMIRKGRKAIGKDAAPKNPATGNRNGSRLYPERLVRGMSHPFYKRPDLMPMLGEKHHSAKLKESDVLEIRRLAYDEFRSVRSLANQYGVSREAIKKIITFRSWKRVGERPSWLVVSPRSTDK